LNTLKMSDTSMNTPNETKASRNKVARPDLYHGDRTKLEEWILQFDLYFKFNGADMDDDDYAAFMASFMRGAAAKWVRPYLIKYMDDDNSEQEITELFDDYLKFKEKLRQTFGVLNEVANADRKIQQLRQIKSAADYAVLFQQYATQTEWDDKALCVMYRQGLKDSVKAELMRSGAQLDALHQLIEESIRIDNALYELHLEMRPVRTSTTPNTSKPRSKGRFSQGRPRFGKTPRGVVPSAGTNWHDPDAMVLDNINKGNGFNKDKKQYGKKITCYNCQKEGHMARDCRSKNKVVRQLNMMIKDNDLDEEWNIVHYPKITDDTQEVVSGLEDLTITTTESMDSPATDAEVTKHEKQERFKNRHRPDTPCPDETWTIDEEINDLRQRLNLPSITFASIQENPRIEEEKKEQYFNLYKEFYQTFPSPPEEENWVDRAMRESDERQANQKRKAEEISRAPKDYYWMDARNPNHASYTWSSCIHDYCPAHYSDKVQAGWYPSTVKGSPKCKWQWYECTKDQCQVHLWDKRTSLYYPGHDDPQEIMQMQIVDLKEYEEGNAYECGQPTWHTCLNPNCDLHAIVKKFYGFQDKAFLEQQQGCKNPRRSTQ
jgi:hypothetical protein